MRLSTVAVIFAATVLDAGAAAGYLARITYADEKNTGPAVNELLRQSGDTSGVWEAISKNRAHHLQSGLVCEAIFVSVPGEGAPKDKPVLILPLQSVSIVASDRPRGDDVACNYEIPNGPLVVIEAIRFKTDEDTRDVFHATEKELRAKFTKFAAMPAPFGIQMRLVEQGELGRGARIENYVAEFEGRRYIATIMVGPVRGWALLIYAVGTSDNEILQQVMVNTQWLTAARWILATSSSRGEKPPQ
jgi:hypothetical protein